MIIFLPTYKRTTTLPYVIQSVLDTDLSGIEERLILLIHNNYYPANTEIDSIVSPFRDSARFQFHVVHRKDNTYIHGWFDAISSVAAEGETIVLLGDDDLLTPWGLRNRYREINSNNADFLLSHYIQRIYFFEGGRLCWPDFPAIKAPAINEKAVPWAYTQSGHVNTSAIFNHCWRNTQAFRAGVKLAYRWCESQPFSKTYTYGLIPSWLPYAIQASGGKVLSLPEHSVIRGSIFEEAMKQDYSDGGSTSFYSLLTYNMFSNPSVFPDRERYTEIRKMHLRILRGGIWENLVGGNVTLRMINSGLKASGLSWFHLLGPELLNFRSLLRLFPFFRGWTLRRKAKDRQALIPTDEFMDRIKRQYAIAAG